MDGTDLDTLMHRLRGGDDTALDALIAATPPELRLHVAWLAGKRR